MPGELRQNRPAGLWRGWLGAACVFLFLWLVYNLNGRFVAGSDVYSSRFLPIQLATKGTYYLDPSKPYHLGTMVTDKKSPSFGKMISVYHAYTPTLLLPIYAPFYRWAKVPPEHFLAFYLDKLIASFLTAAAGALTFSLIRRMHGGRNASALLITLGFWLGTSLWTIASQGSWSHGPSVFYIALAAYALERSRLGMSVGGGRLWALCAGWAAASAFVTRQSNLFFAIPFSVFALLEFGYLWLPWPRVYSHECGCLRSRGGIRRGFGVPGDYFLAGIVPVACWYLIYNAVYFGDPFKTAAMYNLAYQRIPHLMHPENFFAGFFGLLFSPSLGMFTMAPVTLFAVPGMLAVWRDHRSVAEVRPDGSRLEERFPSTFLQRLTRLGVLFIICHIVFYSCYLEWWAGFSYCHRYMIDIQPFLALCAGWFFRPGAALRKFRWPLFAPAFLFSFAVQFYGAFFWNGVKYFDGVHTDPRLYLDLNPRKSHAGIFNVPSKHFSLKRDDHLILGEIRSFLPQMTSWRNLREHFASLPKIKQDLFETRTVEFTPAVPIILESGRKQ